jgi:hypothetical protein
MLRKANCTWELARILDSYLGHGSKISDRTNNYIATDLCSKFQLPMCKTGQKTGNRQTYRQTDGQHNDFSRARYLKMSS